MATTLIALGVMILGLVVNAVHLLGCGASRLLVVPQHQWARFLCLAWGLLDLVSLGLAIAGILPPAYAAWGIASLLLFLEGYAIGYRRRKTRMPQFGGDDGRS